MALCIKLKTLIHCLLKIRGACPQIVTEEDLSHFVNDEGRRIIARLRIDDLWLNLGYHAYKENRVSVSDVEIMKIID